MRFNELNDAALDEGKRQYMEGETAILEGRFKRLADKEFTPVPDEDDVLRSDTVPLKVRIIVPQAVEQLQRLRLGAGEGANPVPDKCPDKTGTSR